MSVSINTSQTVCHSRNQYRNIWKIIIIITVIIKAICVAHFPVVIGVIKEKKNIPLKTVRVGSI